MWHLGGLLWAQNVYNFYQFFTEVGMVINMSALDAPVKNWHKLCSSKDNCLENRRITITEVTKDIKRQKFLPKVLNFKPKNPIMGITDELLNNVNNDRDKKAMTWWNMGIWLLCWKQPSEELRPKKYATFFKCERIVQFSFIIRALCILRYCQKLYIQ